MTDTPPRPRRRRWRWIVVVVLVSIASATWFWPSSDRRFEGTWSMANGAGEVIGTLSLKRIGLSSIKLSPIGSPPSKPQYFLHWEVKNGMLLFGNRPSEFSTIFGQLVHAAAKVPGASFFPIVDTFSIKDLADNRISLTRISPDSTADIGEIQLHRIQE